MTDPVAERDAGAMAAADALMDTCIPFFGDWRLYPKARALRDAIYAALLSERHRAEEEMRERAAEVADEYKAKMAAAQERLGALGRPTFIAECKEDAAESLATAIRALPLSETEK